MDKWEEKHKYIGELLAKRGIKYPRCGFDIGWGWIPAVERCLDRMLAHGWDKELHQVKEKFCGLRVYIGGATDEIYEDIRIAESECDELCEECGKPHGLSVPRCGVALCPNCQRQWDLERSR